MKLEDLHRHQEIRAAIAQHKHEAAELRRRNPTIATLPLTPRGLQTAAEARSRAEAEHRRLEEKNARLAAELETITGAATAEHYDAGSLVTLDLMLSPPDAFEGGGSQCRGSHCLRSVWPGELATL